MTLPGTELENSASENPCFGCGPRNSSGLHLRFFDDGNVVRAHLDPRPDWEGWPENWNLGLAITGAIETSAWAIWERLGPAWPGTISVEAKGALPLTRSLDFEARIEGERKRQVVCLVKVDGKVSLKVTFPVTPMTAEQAASALAGPGHIPSHLKSEFEKRARSSTTGRT